jgi:hypothetical protein
MTVGVEYDVYTMKLAAGLQREFPHLNFTVLSYGEAVQNGTLTGVSHLQPAVFLTLAHTDDGRPRYYVRVNTNTWQTHDEKRTARLVNNIGHTVDAALQDIAEGGDTDAPAIVDIVF